MQVTSLHGMGNHLIVDGFDCDSACLDDIESIRKILDELPGMLKLRKLCEPVVIKHNAEKKEESGITGFVIIAESHISIHTYPLKGYFAMDVFSCKEYDVDLTFAYLKDKLSPRRIEKELIKRGYDELFNADAHCSKIEGIDLKGSDVAGLVRQMGKIGFGATHLGAAAEIIKKMKKDNATIFFSFTSNMVSSGLRELFAEIVKRKLVHVIVTSVGSVEEDLMKTMKPFLLGDFSADDRDLHRKGINRIGNIFVPNDRYEALEDFLIPFFEEMYQKQTATGKMISPSELISELGKRIKDDGSFLRWAAENNIPVFCPAITDGALGLQLYFFKQKRPDFGIDVTADMKQLAGITLSAEKTAGIILGGGVAKHHTIGVNILREGLDYAVYVTTATEYDGSLSGARNSEAISWSKIKEHGTSVCVEGDATIIFPLLAAVLLEND